MSHGTKRTDDDDDGGGSDDDDYAENLNMVNFIEKVALHKKKNENVSIPLDGKTERENYFDKVLILKR